MIVQVHLVHKAHFHIIDRNVEGIQGNLMVVLGLIEGPLIYDPFIKLNSLEAQLGTPISFLQQCCISYEIQNVRRYQESVNIWALCCRPYNLFF